MIISPRELAKLRKRLPNKYIPDVQARLAKAGVHLDETYIRSAISSQKGQDLDLIIAAMQGMAEDREKLRERIRSSGDVSAAV